MCIDLLRALSQRQGPVTLTSAPQVHQLCVLRAAGLVQALFIRHSAGEDFAESGRFLAITPQGRAVLRAGVLPDELDTAALPRPHLERAGTTP